MTATYASVGTGRAVGGTISSPGVLSLTGTDLPSGGPGKVAIVPWGNAGDDPVIFNDAIWDFYGDAEGGAGSWGVDTGKRHISAYASSATLSDPQTFTNGGGNDVANVIMGLVLDFTKTLTYMAPLEIAEASDNIAGSGYSAVMNRDPGFVTGDNAILVFVANSDTPNPAGITCSIPGTSQGTGTTAVFTSPYSQGNDLRITVRRMVITGTSTGPATVASSTDFTGPAMLIRVRDTNTAPAVAPIAAVNDDATADPWIWRAIDGAGSTYTSDATFLWTDETVGGTGTVIFEDATALSTRFKVSPTVWADEDYDLKLTITQAGGTDSKTVTRTVLRSQEMINLDGEDVPFRITSNL